MARGKRYEVGGKVFERQADLEASVKTALNSHPMNVPFIDQFLACVINEHHPEVRAAGQRATGEFEYLDFREQSRRGMDTAQRFRGGNVVMGFFQPLGEWRDVTVYPWRGQGNYRLDVKIALREILAPHLPQPTKLDQCARPGCLVSGAAVEYHHVEPTFDVIAEGALALVTPEEIETRFGYSKFVRGRDDLFRCIPADHAAVRFLLKAHLLNRWEWLCKAHHRNVGVSGQAPSSDEQRGLWEGSDR